VRPAEMLSAVFVCPALLFQRVSNPLGAQT